MSLADRLGLPEERMGEIPALSGSALPGDESLFREAFESAQGNPEQAQVLLAAALLSRARSTPEGRLSAGLALLSRLVARARPEKTLGPEGAPLRERILPSGWTGLAGSWPRFRYAWREGMVDLLDPDPSEQPIVHALDEITRLNPAEPEPVAVAIQEHWPSAPLAFAVTAIGLGLSLRTFFTEVRNRRPARPRAPRSPRSRR